MHPIITLSDYIVFIHPHTINCINILIEYTVHQTSFRLEIPSQRFFAKTTAKHRGTKPLYGIGQRSKSYGIFL